MEGGIRGTSSLGKSNENSVLRSNLHPRYLFAHVKSSTLFVEQAQVA